MLVQFILAIVLNHVLVEFSSGFEVVSTNPILIAVEAAKRANFTGLVVVFYGKSSFKLGLVAFTKCAPEVLFF